VLVRWRLGRIGMSSVTRKEILVGETVAAEAEAVPVPRAGEGSRPLSHVERAAFEPRG
jgi:hypothetical protein